MAMPLPASAPVKVPVNCVYCEDEPSSLFMAGEEALPMLDLEPEENWLRCECAAAPSAAGHGCLVGVELTALCRALGGRWRGFALTHGRPERARWRACGAEGFRINAVGPGTWAAWTPKSEPMATADSWRGIWSVSR